MFILKMGLLFLLSAPTGTAAPKKDSYPAHKIPAHGIEQIQITGVNGKLRLSSRKGPHYVVKVKHSRGSRFEDWHMSIQRQGSSLVIEVFNVAYGKAWRDFVKQEHWPEFDIELSGPAQPALVSWREGDVQISDWAANLEVSLLRGKLRTVKTKRSLKLQAAETDISVVQHNGSLEIKGERGTVDLREVRGELTLSWLSGKVEGHDLVGNLKIEVNEADLRIDGAQGRGDVQLARGRATLSQITGAWKGKGESSHWEWSFKSPGELEMISDSGGVKLRAARKGNRVFLTSAHGKIKVPKPFQVEVREGVRVVEASHGNRPKGEVFVRTKTGDIVWQ